VLPLSWFAGAHDPSPLDLLDTSTTLGWHRVLGEILDIGAAAEPNGELVVVFESEKGILARTSGIPRECVFEDEPTRTLIERADVEISLITLPHHTIRGRIP
jgi:hypothetical protein